MAIVVTVGASRSVQHELIAGDNKDDGNGEVGCGQVSSREY